MGRKKVNQNFGKIKIEILSVKIKTREKSFDERANR